MFSQLLGWVPYVQLPGQTDFSPCQKSDRFDRELPHGAVLTWWVHESSFMCNLTCPRSEIKSIFQKRNLGWNIHVIVQCIMRHRPTLSGILTECTGVEAVLETACRRCKRECSALPLWYINEVAFSACLTVESNLHDRSPPLKETRDSTSEFDRLKQVVL